MTVVAGFLATPLRDKWLLVRVSATLIGVQIALRIASIQRMRGWAGDVAPGAIAMDRIVWSVRTAARRLPGCTCLVSALALQRLLSRNGHESELHIGVARQGERFAAHAWVTHDERILIGEIDGEPYAPLLAWKSGPSDPA